MNVNGKREGKRKLRKAGSRQGRKMGGKVPMPSQLVIGQMSKRGEGRRGEKTGGGFVDGNIGDSPNIGQNA
jgi:hypothetical protein